MQRLLTDKQTAEYLGIGKSTLWKYVASGDIKVVKLGHRSTRFDINDIDQYIESRKSNQSIKNCATPDTKTIEAVSIEAAVDWLENLT